VRDEKFKKEGLSRFTNLMRGLNAMITTEMNEHTYTRRERERERERFNTDI
jgi:hypothetical protein